MAPPHIGSNARMATPTSSIRAAGPCNKRPVRSATLRSAAWAIAWTTKTDTRMHCFAQLKFPFRRLLPLGMCINLDPVPWASLFSQGTSDIEAPPTFLAHVSAECSAILSDLLWGGAHMARAKKTRFPESGRDCAFNWHVTVTGTIAVPSKPVPA